MTCDCTWPEVQVKVMTVPAVLLLPSQLLVAPAGAAGGAARQLTCTTTVQCSLQCSPGAHRTHRPHRGVLDSFNLQPVFIIIQNLILLAQCETFKVQLGSLGDLLG